MKNIITLLIILLSISLQAQIRMNNKQSFVDSTRLNATGDSLYYYQNGTRINSEGIVASSVSPSFQTLSLGEGYADVAKEYHITDGKTVYPNSLGYMYAELLRLNLLSKASLILTPTAIATGVVASQKPLSSDGDFTFTRSTSATRVNENGYIEKETQNLLLQSNTFNTTWTATNASVTSGQSGYDGTNDAWLLTASSTSNARVQQNKSFSGVHTFSVYAKSGTNDFLYLRSNGAVTYECYFNISNGTTSNTSNLITESITSVGGGWYRCSMTFNASSSFDVRAYIVDTFGTVNVTNGTTIYIQDAQLEQGLVARDYIETTTSAVYGGITNNVPRIDYTDYLNPSLLLEPQRTNGVTQSEYFNSWLNKIDVTLDFGYLAPDGTNSAYKITKAGVNAHLADNFGGIIVSGVHKSIWAKTTSGTGDVYLINQNGQNLVTLTNEWQRFDFTHSGANFFYAVDFRGAAVTLSEVLIWGAQVEQGSYPTSYIPTYGTSVTRGDDYMQVIPTDLLGSDIGTWYLELDDLIFENIGTQVPTIYLGDNDTNCLALEAKNVNNNKSIHLVKEENNTSTTLYSFIFSEKTKICFVWDGTALKIFKDGSSVYSATDFTQPINWDEFVYNYVSREAMMKISNIKLFPTALTDSECIALTKIN